MSQKRHRNYCFTLNNYTKEDTDMLKGSLLFTYIIFGEEIAPTTGTPHLQGYFEMAEAKTISALVKKWLPKGIHLEPAKGSKNQNKEYCSKGQNIYESGEAKNQGERTDLVLIKESIEKGQKVDDICMIHPDLYHLYGRTLSKIEDIVLRKKFRNWMTTCDWYYGPTGIGKSHTAFENFDPEKCYVWKDDNGWQDGYTGQEVVIINEFRGNIPFSILLQLIDKYPFELRRRGREPVPFLAKKIIITSSLRPEEVYSGMSQNDSILQLMRRVTLFYKKKQEHLWVPMNGITLQDEEEYYELYQEFKGEL